MKTSGSHPPIVVIVSHSVQSPYQVLFSSKSKVIRESDYPLNLIMMHAFQLGYMDVSLRLL